MGAGGGKGSGVYGVIEVRQNFPDTAFWEAHVVTDQNGEASVTVTLPDNLTAVPIGTYVLILFDGQGPAGDDYDPADGKITLHTPPGVGDIFPDASGQVALYRPGTLGAGTLADFVAWGALDEAAAANAIAAGVWGAGEAASFENGLGDTSQKYRQSDRGEHEPPEPRHAPQPVVTVFHCRPPFWLENDGQVGNRLVVWL